MRLLDTFCKAGGATKGYQMAGFEVVGVDIEPQPHYCGDAFIQADALDVLYALAHGDCWPDQKGRDWHLEDFDAIHASPPCQAFTKYKNLRKDLPERYPDLIDRVRCALVATSTLWVIENVEGSPLNEPIILCGSMFGLDVRRHRLFETPLALLTPPCNHAMWQPNRFPGGRSIERGGPQVKVRATVEVGKWGIPLATQQAAMGISWTTLAELSEAIPPAYTEFVGKQLLRHLLP